MGSETDGSRLLGLDELRGVAILAVMLSHLREPFALSGKAADIVLGPAWSAGVDLFFAISGLVVLRSLYTLRSTQGRFGAARAFYVRRVMRIVPLVWLVGGVLAAGIVLGGVMVGDVISALSFTANGHWSRCYGGAAGCGNPLVYSPFWSVATEMQFYLVAPLIVLGLTRRAIIALAVLVLVVGLFLDRPWGGALWAFRVDGIAVGLAIGALIGSRPWKAWFSRLPPMGNAEAVFWLGVAAVLVAVLPAVVHGFATVLVALICGMIVVRSILRAGSANAAGRALAWVGHQSFALYLVNLPIFALAALLLPQDAVPVAIVMAIAVGAAFGMAWLLTRYVGDPLYDLGRRWSAPAARGVAT